MFEAGVKIDELWKLEVKVLTAMKWEFYRRRTGEDTPPVLAQY